MSETKVASLEERIANRINQDEVRTIAVSSGAGGLEFSNAAQAMDFARLMAISGVAIPQHLRGNPGACLAIIIQAVEWRLSPYAVANKSYSVNDRLAYESQLIQAVILQRAPIKGRLKVEYSGVGEARVCRVSATLADTGETVDYSSPPFARIHPKNSPLWKSDPDQQQFYYSGRALCRRHFPDVLLGIYARDEIDPAEARDITPTNGPKTLAGRLDALAQRPDERAETVEAETPAEAPTSLRAELRAQAKQNEAVDPLTGEVTMVALLRASQPPLAMTGGPDAVPEGEDASRGDDPRAWSAADAYHHGEEARRRGVTRKAVVPPAIRDHEVLAPAVISGWEAASANP